MVTGVAIMVAGSSLANRANAMAIGTTTDMSSANAVVQPVNWGGRFEHRFHRPFFNRHHRHFFFHRRFFRERFRDCDWDDPC